MTEYESNKAKLHEYRKRNRNNRKIVEWLCKIMEWFNNNCIKN